MDLFGGSTGLKHSILFSSTRGIAVVVCGIVFSDLGDFGAFMESGDYGGDDALAAARAAISTGAIVVYAGMDFGRMDFEFGVARGCLASGGLCGRGLSHRVGGVVVFVPTHSTAWRGDLVAEFVGL